MKDRLHVTSAGLLHGTSSSSAVRSIEQPGSQSALARGAAHELEEPLAALMSSSARHSEMVLMLRKADSRAPVVSR